MLTKVLATIPSKKSHDGCLQIDELKNSSKRPLKMQKRKTYEIKGFGTILRGSNTMIPLAISNYEPLTRDTNLGWREAQTKSQHSPLFLSPRAPKRKEHSHPTSHRDGCPTSHSYIWSPPDIKT
jgi:hypothetical protein